MTTHRPPVPAKRRPPPRRQPPIRVFVPTHQDPHPDAKLRDMIAYIERNREEGVSCPCCGQLVRVYRRQIHRSIAETMILMYQRRRRRWVYLPDIPQRSRDFSFAAHWHLVERRRNGDGYVEGWWRLTEHGVAWLYNEVDIRRYALIDRGKLLRFEGPWWSIQDALGHGFDIEDI